MESSSEKTSEPRKLAELKELFDTVGKALAVVAGLAVVVYLIGGLTVLIRLHRLNLPAEVVIPEIPKERLALLGLTQLLWSLVLAGLIAAIAFYGLPARRRDDSNEPLLAVKQRRVRWLILGLVGLGLIAIAPWSVNGVIYLVLVAGATIWFMRYGLRVHPALTVLVAIGLAGVITGLREAEFPTPFPTARVKVDEEIEKIREARHGTFGARVIETTDDEVLLGHETPSQEREEQRTGERLDPNLVVLKRDQITKLRYAQPLEPQSHSDSISQELLGVPPLMCFAMVACEWDTEPGAQDEHREPVATVPFAF